MPLRWCLNVRGGWGYACFLLSILLADRTLLDEILCCSVYASSRGEFGLRCGSCRTAWEYQR